MTELAIETMIGGILKGDRRSLSRAITLVESRLDSHRITASALVDALVPHSGQSVRLGVTGVPGVGKSTFIEKLGLELTGRGHKVAVLAVDPSSGRSGGSILGDKTRMPGLSADPKAYVRPSPAGGTLGGVAARTRETMILCEAAGFDVVIVETVGVGQSETAVASMVDFFLLLMLAGAGDELQGIKRGIMELADAIAINKADGDNVDHAVKAGRDVENALHYLTASSPVWRPVVLTISSLENRGIKDVWSTVLEHRSHHEKAGELALKRRNQAVDWMHDLVEEKLKQEFYERPTVMKRLPELTRAVEQGLLSPGSAVRRLFSAQES